MSVLKVKKNGAWENVSGTSWHTHNKDQLIGLPTTLPANGGNADTVDGKHAADFALAAELNTLFKKFNELVGTVGVSEQIATAIVQLKNDLLNGAGEAYDTLKELGDLIENNASALEALEEIAITKADAVHTHHDTYYTKSEVDEFMDFMPQVQIITWEADD